MVHLILCLLFSFNLFLFLFCLVCVPAFFAVHYIQFIYEIQLTNYWTGIKLQWLYIHCAWDFTSIYIYIYTRFQKHCNLKNILYTYIYLLFSYLFFCFHVVKTKDEYIYIFQVAMFLTSGSVRIVRSCFLDVTSILSLLSLLFSVYQCYQEQDLVAW